MNLKSLSSNKTEKPDAHKYNFILLLERLYELFLYEPLYHLRYQRYMQLSTNIQIF